MQNRVIGKNVIFLQGEKSNRYDTEHEKTIVHLRGGSGSGLP